MRKLVLVVIALVLAALVWMFARILAPSITRSPEGIAPKAGSQAVTALDPLVDGVSNADTASRSALDSSAEPSTESKLASKTRCGLRAVVHFERGEDYKPQGLDVRVLDLLGEDHVGQLERGNAFLFSDLSPDTYTIDVTETASMKAVQRVKLDTLGETKVVDITLSPTRSLKVHWTASDGRPIAQAVLDPHLEPGEPLLAIVASHVPLQQADFGCASARVASIKVSAANRDPFDERDDFGPPASDRDGTSEGSLDRAEDSSDPGLFCTFEIRTKGTLWLSAWYRGALMGSQSISRDQTDVYFTTLPPQLNSLLVPVSLRLVDDVTGAPVTSARVMVTGESTQVLETDSQGRCSFKVEPGWTRIDVQRKTDPIELRVQGQLVYFGQVEAKDLALAYMPTMWSWVHMKVLARTGEPLELGDIRLPHARSLRFRVLDSLMRPVSGAKCDLILESSYDEVTGEYAVQHAGSDSQGLVVFSGAANETYVVACSLIRLGRFDSEPLIVDARKVGDDADAIAGEITLRPLRKVSIAFDPPPRPGAKVLIETTTGLPVSSQVLDELGLCVLGLGGEHYQLRLVEDGHLQRTVPFSVTSDPFALTVQR